jgi:hypothetical protein
MSNGFASDFEISEHIIRDNLLDGLMIRIP